MQKRYRLYSVLVVSLCLIAFALGLWFHKDKRPYVRHEPIDTHNLARFLGCYAHNFTIPKKALTPYRTCELQIVHRDGRIQALSGANSMRRNDDGDFEVVLLMMPADRTKTFNDAPQLDYYFNGMGGTCTNPFLGLLSRISVCYVRDDQIRHGELLLLEFDERPTPDEEVTRVAIRLKFS